MLQSIHEHWILEFDHIIGRQSSRTPVRHQVVDPSARYLEHSASGWATIFLRARVTWQDICEHALQCANALHSPPSFDKSSFTSPPTCTKWSCSFSSLACPSPRCNNRLVILDIPSTQQGSNSTPRILSRRVRRDCRLSEGTLSLNA